MVVYRNRSSQPLKWVVALIVFILAMTFTLAEVDGASAPETTPDSNQVCEMR
jgi:hypothetical protein